MKYVIDQKKIDDEIFVLASDNIFDFELTNMMDLYREKNADVISAHYIPDIETLRSMGVVELNDESKVIDFVEKPAEPKSHYGAPPFYIYRKGTLALINQYLEEGNNPDAPGHFIPWLITKTDVYAYTFDVMTIDIGTPKSYYEAQKLFD